MLVGLGVLFFGEKLTANALCWLLVAFGGMLFIIIGQTGAITSGSDYLRIIMALGAVFMYAVTAAIIKRLKGLATTSDCTDSAVGWCYFAGTLRLLVRFTAIR